MSSQKISSMAAMMVVKVQLDTYIGAWLEGKGTPEMKQLARNIISNDFKVNEMVNAMETFTKMINEGKVDDYLANQFKNFVPDTVAGYELAERLAEEVEQRLDNFSEINFDK